MKMNDLPGTIVWPDLVWGECGQDHMHPSHHHQIPGLLLPVVVYTCVYADRDRVCSFVKWLCRVLSIQKM